MSYAGNPKLSNLKTFHNARNQELIAKSLLGLNKKKFKRDKISYLLVKQSNRKRIDFKEGKILTKKVVKENKVIKKGKEVIEKTEKEVIDHKKLTKLINKGKTIDGYTILKFRNESYKNDFLKTYRKNHKNSINYLIKKGLYEKDKAPKLYSKEVFKMTQNNPKYGAKQYTREFEIANSVSPDVFNDIVMEITKKLKKKFKVENNDLIRMKFASKSGVVTSTKFKSR